MNLPFSPPAHRGGRLPRSAAWLSLYLHTCTLLLLLAGFPVMAHADRFDIAQLTLPVYEVDMDADDLAYLLENPKSEEEFHALVGYNNHAYPAMLSLRGATARTLPKKSFQLQFTGTTPRGYSEVNLNAEYRDLSYARNLLAMRLAENLGLHAPAGRHVSLVINGVYYGVYTEIEEVDDEFFERRGLDSPEFMVKSIRHSGAFVPMMNPEETRLAYDFKAFTPALLDTFATRRMLLQFGDPQLVSVHISRILDIKNVLKFYAMQYAIANLDGMTKNYYLFSLPDGRYRMVPWDCDASFGNQWTGDWDPSLKNVLYFMMLERAPLFSRMMDQEYLRGLMRQNVEDIANGGFGRLHKVIDEIQISIRHDVELDTLKQGTMDDFELAFERPHEYLNDRAAVLTGLTVFDKRSGLDYQIAMNKNEELNSLEEVRTLLITMRAESDADRIAVKVGTESPFDSYRMYDDGSHGDEIKDDDIWSTLVEIDDGDEPLYYCFTTRQTDCVLFWHPAGGILDYNKYRSQLPCLPRKFNQVPEPGSLEFGPSWYSATEGTWLATIINRSADDIELPGQTLHFDNSYTWYSLVPCDTLAAGDTLFIASDPDIERGRAPWRNVYGPVPLNLPDAHKLTLRTWDGQFLDQVSLTPEPVTELVGRGVINEINYNGPDNPDAGDWVELVFADTVESIEGWTLLDELDTHQYQFTAEDDSRRKVNDGYLVLASDADQFRSVFGSVTALAGPCGFGFSNSGEAIRLYDSTGVLVDHVRYLDVDQWPEGADGTGRTLELVNRYLPNSDPLNWQSSADTAPLGTPGKENSVAEDDSSTFTSPDEDYWDIVTVTPNPADSRVAIHVHTPQRGWFQLQVFNVLGQPVSTLTGWADRAGTVRAGWDCSRVASGMYFVRLDEGGQTLMRKLVVVQ